MNYGKPVGALGVLVVLVVGVGAVSTLFRRTLLGPPGRVAAVGTVALVVAVLVAIIWYGVRSGRIVANPYW